MEHGHMNVKFLSETEWKYLTGEFKPDEVYDRKLRSKIAKKAEQFIEAMPDFALILTSEKLPERVKERLLNWNNYNLKILPFSQALYLSLLHIGREEDDIRRLQDSLEEAGIPYQAKRLRVDEDYRLAKSMVYAKWLHEKQPHWFHELELARLEIKTETSSVKRKYAGLLIDDNVWKNFKKTVNKKTSMSLKRAINEALKEWISKVNKSNASKKTVS
jgi:hypothetical protein